MANVGKLEPRDTNGGVVFMGHIAVIDLVAANIAVGVNPNIKEGATMTHNVMAAVSVNGKNVWSQIGRATIKRKNQDKAWYIEMVLETPRILRENDGKALWVNAFPTSGNVDVERDKLDAESYDIILGGSSKPSAMAVLGDDEIPEFN